MKSELAYNLADYRKHNVEPPERIIAHPEACEGDLMTDEEIFAYCKDSLAVLRVMADRNPERGEELRRIFLTDCEFLLKIGRIEEEDFDLLITQIGEA